MLFFGSLVGRQILNTTCGEAADGSVGYPPERIVAGRNQRWLQSKKMGGLWSNLGLTLLGSRTVKLIFLFITMF